MAARGVASKVVVTTGLEMVEMVEVVMMVARLAEVEMMVAVVGVAGVTANEEARVEWVQGQ